MGVATTMAIIGGVAAASQAVAGAQQAKSAANALKNLKVPETVNPYANAQVSTLGADLQREESARGQASDIEALQGAGARGLVGGVGRVQAQSNLQNQQIAADLDKQQKDIQSQKAQADMSIMGIKENRFVADKAGLSSQISQGNQQMWAGIGGVAQAGMSAASSLSSGATAKSADGYTGGGGMTTEQLQNSNLIKMNYTPPKIG